jgi:hypothetical protein
VHAPEGSIDELITFLTDWHGTPDAKYGVPASELPAGLPEPLRRLYAVAGRWPGRDPESHVPDAPGILQNQDFLVRAEDLSPRDGWFDVIYENQESWSIRVRANDPAGVPHSNAHWMWDDAGMDDYVPLTPTLEHVLMSFALQESVLGADFLASVDDGDAWAAAWAEAEPVWENGWYVFEEPTHSFRRNGHFLLANIAGDGWIGWNDADARLGEAVAASSRMIHSPE